VILLPILGAMADYSNNLKKFLMTSTFVTCIFVCLMFFVSDSTLWWLGALLFLLTTIGFGASSVFYDSFLNLISDESERMQLSSRGFAVGYLGAAIFLGAATTIHQNYPSDFTIRLIFVAAGFWWFGWSLVTFKFLREHRRTDLEQEQTLIVGDKKKKIPQNITFLWDYVSCGIAYVCSKIFLFRCCFSLLLLFTMMEYRQ